MPPNPDWKTVYAERLPIYERLKSELEFTLAHVLIERGIKAHSVASRVKTAQSIEEKASRKSYEQPIAQTSDIVGARIVVLFLADMPRVASAITETFDVLTVDDKVQEAGLEAFGYMSQHYLAKFTGAYTGPRYEPIREYPFEIQLRTILMDAWANVSHYLAYKGEASIPAELRKDFFALSGLFYVADKHFELFFDRAEDVQARARIDLASGRSLTELEINLDTLTAFLQSVIPTASTDLARMWQSWPAIC